MTGGEVGLGGCRRTPHPPEKNRSRPISSELKLVSNWGGIWGEVGEIEGVGRHAPHRTDNQAELGDVKNNASGNANRKTHMANLQRFDTSYHNGVRQSHADLPYEGRSSPHSNIQELFLLLLNVLEH